MSQHWIYDTRSSVPHEEWMTDISQLFQCRTHSDDLLKLCLVGADLFKIHDGKVADFDGSVVQLSDHKLQAPIVQYRGSLEQTTELMGRE